MPERPTLRAILTEAADTQHTAVLTWQEARTLLDALDGHTAFREAVQRTYDLQCPPMPADTYVDRGAHMAHQWWSTCLGAVLRDVRYSPGSVTT